MNQSKENNDISSKVQNMKLIMRSLFTDNDVKSISSILCVFRTNRNIQYLVDNIQPYLDTKVKLDFLYYLGEIIPKSHQGSFHGYCNLKGLESKKLSTNNSSIKRTFLLNCNLEDSDFTEPLDLKSYRLQIFVNYIFQE